MGMGQWERPRRHKERKDQQRADRLRQQVAAAMEAGQWREVSNYADQLAQLSASNTVGVERNVNHQSEGAKEASTGHDDESVLLSSIELQPDSTRARFVAAMMASDYEAAQALYPHVESLTTDDLLLAVALNDSHSDETEVRQEVAQPLNDIQERNKDTLLNYLQNHRDELKQYLLKRFKATTSDLDYLVDEAIQDTAVRILQWVKEPNISLVEDPVGFLRTVAKRKLLDRIRSDRKLKFKDNREIEKMMGDDGSDEAHKTMDNGAASLLDAASSVEEVFIEKDQFILAHLLYGLLAEGGKLEGKTVLENYENQQLRPIIERSIYVLTQHLRGRTYTDIAVELVKSGQLPGDPSNPSDLKIATDTLMRGANRLLEKYIDILGREKPEHRIRFKGKAASSA